MMNSSLTMMLNNYLNHIREDYASTMFASGPRYEKTYTDEQKAWHKQMIENFNRTLRIEPGKKYLKVVSGGGSGTGSSVHSFIVATENDAKFKLGTILKANSWRTPARNFARGNVLEGDWKRIPWMGC